MAFLSTSAENTFLTRLRSAFPYILTALLFALGTYALYHLIRPGDLKQVMTQVRGTPTHIIALAILATTLVGYTALIGYDWSA